MSKKLLIVDDSQVSRQVIRNYVVRQRPDWAIFESDNGFDALEMVGFIKPDFVTMDVNMPKMSGLIAAEEIVKKSPGIRVVVLTANLQDMVQKRVKELSMRFIEKPVSEESIVKAIQFLEVAHVEV